MAKHGPTDPTAKRACLLTCVLVLTAGFPTKLTELSKADRAVSFSSRKGIWRVKGFIYYMDLFIIQIYLLYFYLVVIGRRIHIRETKK